MKKFYPFLGLCLLVFTLTFAFTQSGTGLTFGTGSTWGGTSTTTSGTGLTFGTGSTWGETPNPGGVTPNPGTGTTNPNSGGVTPNPGTGTTNPNPGVGTTTSPGTKTIRVGWIYKDDGGVAPEFVVILHGPTRALAGGRVSVTGDKSEVDIVGVPRGSIYYWQVTTVFGDEHKESPLRSDSK